MTAQAAGGRRQASVNDMTEVSTGRASWTTRLSAGQRASDKGYTCKSARNGSPDLTWIAPAEVAPAGEL